MSLSVALLCLVGSTSAFATSSGTPGDMLPAKSPFPGSKSHLATLPGRLLSGTARHLMRPIPTLKRHFMKIATPTQGKLRALKATQLYRNLAEALALWHRRINATSAYLSDANNKTDRNVYLFSTVGPMLLGTAVGVMALSSAGAIDLPPVATRIAQEASPMLWGFLSGASFLSSLLPSVSLLLCKTPGHIKRSSDCSR